MDKQFTFSYLPLFEQDVAAARDYIAVTLMNPAAPCAWSKILIEFEPYHSKKDRAHPYYCINIKNYTVFYVVIDNVMEVRRFVCSKRDLPQIL